jgi:hypothetical protein
MGFGEIQLVEFVLKHVGILGALLLLCVLLGLRFLPAYLQDLREKRLVHLQARNQVQAAHSERERALFARLDRKDEVLEKLTGNHIQHLEAELSAARSFYEAATRTLQSLDNGQKELRADVRELHVQMERVEGGVDYLKGRGI